MHLPERAVRRHSSLPKLERDTRCNRQGVPCFARLERSFNQRLRRCPLRSCPFTLDSFFMRTRIFQIVQRAQKDDALSRAYDAFVAAVAFLSIVPLMFRPQDMGPHLAAFMSGLELTSVYVLSFDYLLRWMTYDLKCGKPGWRSFVRYPFTPLAIIDLLSILPSLAYCRQTSCSCAPCASRGSSATRST